MTTLPAFDAAEFARRRWLVFALLVIAYMVVFFHRMAAGAIAGDLMQAFNTSGAALGSLAAMYYYIYTAMQIPSGVLADTLGPRVSIGIGSIFAAAGSITFGLAPSFEIAAVGRFLIGFGVSTVFVSLMRSNTVWFSEKRYGMISGITLLFGNLGSMFAAGPLAILLTEVSWRHVFVGAGVFSLVLAVFVFWLVRNKPEDAGFPSIREQQGLPAHPQRQHHWWPELKKVAKTPAIWPGFWVHLGASGALFAFAGLWGIPVMQDGHGLSRESAALYTTAMLGGLAVGSLIMGSLSDAIGHRKPIIVGCALVSCILWSLMIFTPWQPGWSGVALYLGLGLAAGGPVVVYASAKEIVPPSVAGMAIALVNTGLFLGAAIMQPLFGWVLDQFWDGTLVDGIRHYNIDTFRYGFWLSLGFASMGLVGALRMRETYCRNITVTN